MSNDLINAKQTALYLKANPTLPTPPDGFIETIDPLLVVPNFAMIDTNRLSGQMNSKDSVVDTCRASSSFLAKVALRETGTATLTKAPEWAELAKISALKIASSAPADTYELVNNRKHIPTGSARVSIDNGSKEFSFTDTLVGDISFILPVGQIGTVEAVLSGYIDDAVPADVNLTPPTLEVNPPLVVSCADIITLKGVSIPAEKIVFKMNPDISKTYTMGGAKGIKKDIITDYGITCEITFPVESATFGREASMIDTGEIAGIRVILGADDQGKPVDGKSFLFLADATKAVTYKDTVNKDLLQRVLTLRLYDGNVSPALRILSGKISGM